MSVGLSSAHFEFLSTFFHRLDEEAFPFPPSSSIQLIDFLAVHVSCNNNGDCAPSLPFIASAIKMRRIAEIPEVPSGGEGGKEDASFVRGGSGGQIPLEKINLDFSQHSSAMSDPPRLKRRCQEAGFPLSN